MEKYDLLYQKYKKHMSKLPAGVKKIAYGMMEFAKTMVACIDVEEVNGKHHIKK